MGIEKESLRVNQEGNISQELHPQAYGSALTNPVVTTDFSEALIDDQTAELFCHDCGPQSKLSLNKNSLIFLQNLEKLHLDDIQPGMNNTVEMYNAISFLEIFTCIHLEGMDKVRSLNMIHKLLKQ